MKRVFPYLFILGIWACYPAHTPAQYLGAGRPMSRLETLDSLGAKPDSSELNALRDSLAAYPDSGKFKGAGVTKYFTGNNLDSLVFSGGGAGGAAVGDSVIFNAHRYDFVIGWDGSPEEDITLAGVPDSATGDTLLWAINQLKTSGGNILLKAGDTIFCYAGSHYDSLPTAGGLTKPVHVWGIDRQPVIYMDYRGWQAKASRGFYGLHFHNLSWTGPAGKRDGILDYVGGITVENCRINKNGIPTACKQAITDYSKADSVITVINCEFDNARCYINGGAISIINCYGSLEKSDAGGASSRYTILKIIGSDLVVDSLDSGDTFYDRLNIVGSVLRQKSTANPLIYGGGHLHATGSSFYFKGTTNDYLTCLNFYIQGCFFYKGGVRTGGANNVITGSTIQQATTGIDVDHDIIQITSNLLYVCTAGINSAAGTDSVMVVGNGYLANTSNWTNSSSSYWDYHNYTIKP